MLKFVKKLKQQCALVLGLYLRWNHTSECPTIQCKGPWGISILFFVTVLVLLPYSSFPYAFLCLFMPRSLHGLKLQVS